MHAARAGATLVVLVLLVAAPLVRALTPCAAGAEGTWEGEVDVVPEAAPSKKGVWKLRWPVTWRQTPPCNWRVPSPAAFNRMFAGRHILVAGDSVSRLTAYNLLSWASGWWVARCVVQATTWSRSSIVVACDVIASAAFIPLLMEYRCLSTLAPH